MATAFDNKKYDIQLNDVPYRIRGYQRSELSTFIPRLGSGEQSESEFDLLRSASIKGFTGGELQRFWKDDTSAYGIEGFENKYDDGVIYPTETLETVLGDIYGSSKPKMTCYLILKDYVYVAYTTYNTPTAYLNRITRSTGTVTSITLPSNISGSTIVGLQQVGNRYIYITEVTGQYMAYLDDESDTTASEITGGTANCAGGKTVTYRGELYGLDGSNGPNWNSNLKRHTGGITSRSYESVGTIGPNTRDSTADLLVYNNRILIIRRDGIWAYDGIQINQIETTGFDWDNYKTPAVLKGYLYYFMPDGMYRFNGSLIEKLYDISESGIPVAVTEAENKLWYVYTNSEFSGSTRYDKSMGYDYSSGDNVQGRLSYFNGQGMYTHSRLGLFDKGTITEDFSGQGEPDGVIVFDEKIYVTTSYSKYTTNLHRTDTTQPTTRSVVLTTSIFNADFSQINKQLENIELEFDGDVVDDTFTVEYRTSDFEGDTGWTSLGTLTASTATKLNVYDLIPAGVVFRDIQFQITASMTFGYGIKTLILRYVLVPDYKYQWTFTALCYGDSNLAPAMLQDTTESTQDVGDLRGNIYESRESDIPVGFVDIDYLVLNEDLDNSETTIDVVSTAILKSSTGFVQVGTEIMKYTAKTSTTLTVVRGVLGTTATTHSNGVAVYPYYRTILRTIQNERIELYDEESITINRTRDSEITIVLQEV